MLFKSRNQMKIEEVVQLCNQYKTAPGLNSSADAEAFAKDVDKFLHFRHLKEYITTPEAFADGEAMKKVITDCLGALYNVRRSWTAKDRLFDFIYTVHESIDLIPFIDGFTKHHSFLKAFAPLERTAAQKETFESIFQIFEYCYASNMEKLGKIRTPAEAKGQAGLIYAHLRVANFMLIHAHWSTFYSINFSLKAMEVEKIDTLASQLFMQEYSRIHFGSSCLTYGAMLTYLMGEDEAKVLLESEMWKGNVETKAQLKHISANDIPCAMGYEFLEIHHDKNYDIFCSENIDPRFRLCALKRVVGDTGVSEQTIITWRARRPDGLKEWEQSLMDQISAVMFPITAKSERATQPKQKDLKELLTDIKRSEQKNQAEKETLLSREEITYWADTAAKLLNEEIYGDTSKLYACNKDAKVLMCALIMAAAGFAEVDIVTSLQLMPEVLSFANGEGHELMTAEQVPDRLIGNRPKRVILQDMSKGLDLAFYLDTLPQYLVLKDGNANTDEVVGRMKERFLKG